MIGFGKNCWWGLAFALACGLAGCTAPSARVSKPVPTVVTNPVPTTPVQFAIRDLSSEEYAAREEAQRRLLGLVEKDYEAALKECLQVYQRTTDPEVKYRLTNVMAKVVDEKLFRAPRGYLGAGLFRVNILGNGKLIINGVAIPPGAVLVTQVVEGSGAERAGLKVNDCIVAVDGEKWTSGSDEFIKYVQAKRPGSKLKLTLLRGNANVEAEAVLGEQPKELQEQLFTEERSREFFEYWLRTHLSK